MIVSRKFEPEENQMIYHYCDANTFHSICTNRKLWFNDLFSMNDYMELHWGYSIWEEAASIRLDKYGKAFLDEIDEIIHFSGFQGLLLASCFSTERDVLSQWRAYADDAKGYVIGFNAKDLLGLPIRALEVLYNKEEQVKEATAGVDMLHLVNEKDVSDFRSLSIVFGYDLSAFKNPAFSEEKEVRLVHLLDFKESNNSLKLVDEGGEYFGKERNGEQVKFRMKQNIPTPYIELDFTNSGMVNPIKEVVIGPKNEVMTSSI